MQGFENVQMQMLSTLHQLSEQVHAQQSQIEMLTQQLAAPRFLSQESSAAEKFEAQHKKLLRALLLLDQRVEQLENDE